MKCSVCGTKSTGPIYRPENSEHKVGIYICDECGLLESHPKKPTGGKGGTTSSARYGGIRHNKQFSTQHAIDRLKETIDDPTTVLDVGASRGDFMKAAAKVWPNAKVYGIEPDARLVEQYKDLGMWHQSIEEFFRHASHPEFDIIHMCHTLEHLRDPVAVLSKLSKICTGVMYVEVPNIDMIHPDNCPVEEAFIDRHYFHFSETTLMQTLIYSGWNSLIRGRYRDALWVVAAPGGPKSKPKPNVERARLHDLVADYANALPKCRQALEDTVGAINGKAATQRVIVWGAGRICNQMVKSGLSRNVVVVDKYRRDDGVYKPDDLVFPPDVVAVASRVYKGEIIEEAKELWPDVEIITVV